MAHIEKNGLRYTCEAHGDGGAAVSCQHDATLKLLSRVNLPAEAVPVMRAALGEIAGDDATCGNCPNDQPDETLVEVAEKLGAFVTAEDAPGLGLLELVDRLVERASVEPVDVEAMKVEARDAAVADLQADHDVETKALQAAIAERDEELAQLRAATAEMAQDDAASKALEQAAANPPKLEAVPDESGAEVVDLAAAKTTAARRKPANGGGKPAAKK